MAKRRWDQSREKLFPWVLSLNRPPGPKEGMISTGNGRNIIEDVAKHRASGISVKPSVLG